MIAPAAKSVEAERTAIAAELELSAGQALVAQAGTAADSRQAARTAPMTVLFLVTEPAPAARTAVTTEVRLAAGSCECGAWLRCTRRANAPLFEIRVRSGLEPFGRDRFCCYGWLLLGASDTGGHHRP
ncbi:hypothetical protein PC120_g24109 [Phytophthora cactorum]|nr:hypothetical protein PC120_g24109 [Phytophthora cactorum]